MPVVVKQDQLTLSKREQILLAFHVQDEFEDFDSLAHVDVYLFLLALFYFLFQDGFLFLDLRILFEFYLFHFLLDFFITALFTNNLGFFHFFYLISLNHHSGRLQLRVHGKLPQHISQLFYFFG